MGSDLCDDYPGPRLDLPLKDVRTTHIRELVEKLERRPSKKGGTLSPRTVCNTHGILHTLFEHAKADELVANNPCDLPVGVLPERDDKDPTWRSTAIFSRDEVEQLISDDRIPLDRRVLYALLFLGGGRWGETVALQWRDWDPAMKPLGRLDVHKSFSTRLKRTKVWYARAHRAEPHADKGSERRRQARSHRGCASGSMTTSGCRSS